jgi:hypothetical protein
MTLASLLDTFSSISAAAAAAGFSVAIGSFDSAGDVASVGVAGLSGLLGSLLSTVQLITPPASTWSCAFSNEHRPSHRRHQLINDIKSTKRRHAGPYHRRRVVVRYARAVMDKAQALRICVVALGVRGEQLLHLGDALGLVKHVTAVLDAQDARGSETTVVSWRQECAWVSSSSASGTIVASLMHIMNDFFASCLSSMRFCLLLRVALDAFSCASCREAIINGISGSSTL